jgi:hypothetical protein
VIDVSSDLHTPAPTTATPEKPEDPIYAWAHERAEMIQGLYIHLLVFVVINAGLFGINWATRGDDGTWWAVWPLLTWGIALLIHVLVTVAPVFSDEWVERRAERIAARRR